MSFSSLRILDLSDNRLTEVSTDLHALRNVLTGLSIQGNPISQLPPFITDMTKLMHLHMGNTLIKELPEDIGNMESLTILNIRVSTICRLPASFAKLTVSIVDPM